MIILEVRGVRGDRRCAQGNEIHTFSIFAARLISGLRFICLLSELDRNHKSVSVYATDWMDAPLVDTVACCFGNQVRFYQSGVRRTEQQVLLKTKLN